MEVDVEWRMEVEKGWGREARVRTDEEGTC